MYTLPGRYYTDDAQFRKELERFFFGMWISAGRAEQIAAPGEYFLREIGEESVIITRDRDGIARAFYNVCRHRGTRMCTAAEGQLPGRIQCPYHGWTYGLDGRLLGAPHMDESTFRRDEYPLHPIALDEWAGHLFISFAADPAPLAEQLGPLPAKFASWRMNELRRVHRLVYDVKANWKLIVLNYNECLHCPVLHPVLNRLTHYLGADNEPATETYMGGAMDFKDGAETMSLDGRRRRAYLPGLSETERRHVYYYAIYPNFLLSLHPDYVLTHTLWPRAVDRTEIVCELHCHPDEIARPEFDPSDAVGFWDLTNREDWGISELAQAGIRSRAYRPGPYSPRERMLWEFDRIVERANRSE